MADGASLPARLARAIVRIGSFRVSTNSMPRISVLIPTHEHATTLPYAVRSVQRQGVEDLEILICGDGVSNELRAVITELQQAEPRIRFFDLPKAPRIGELNRDHVLRQANGRIVCIHNDDDLWLPGHIEVVERALEDADFVGAMQVNVGTDGKVRAHYFDLERPEFVEPWLDWKPNNFWLLGVQRIRSPTSTSKWLQNASSCCTNSCPRPSRSHCCSTRAIPSKQ